MKFFIIYKTDIKLDEFLLSQLIFNAFKSYNAKKQPKIGELLNVTLIANRILKFFSNH